MARGMRPADLLRIKWLSDPRVSPDGERIAFVVATLDEERDEYLSNVWLVDRKGGRPRRFTAGRRRDHSPRWSPDGRWLAFVSERDGARRPQLHVIPADGGEPTRLTDLEHGVSDPAWSPDSRRLAFVARVGGEKEPTTDEERRKSRPARVITTLKYRSNGEGFVYDRRPHVFVVSIDGGKPKQITDGDFVDADPAWSPDGRTIAFASARHEERDYDDSSDLWTVAPDGGEPRRLTDTRGPVRRPSFSPDGRHIAYLGHEHRDDSVARNTNVFVVAAEGGAPTCLSAALDRNAASSQPPEWLADGSSLLVAVDDHGDVPVVSLDVGRRGGTPRIDRVVGGARQVSGFSLSGDGQRLAYIASTPTMPGELFADGRQITDLNRAWRRSVALSEPERFRFERDGFEIDGWVMRPAGFEAGRRYPVLLNIHGGPATQYGHSFFDEFQVYAGAGYAVVFTNPRGSQGYGEGFARAVLDDWGGGDYRDVIAGLDEALRRFDFLDPTRLGVMGGSYGGFMTTWIVGHDHRFKAACSERALNTWVSFYGSSDIGHFFGEKYLHASPLDGVEKLVKHSPLSYARDVRTPLLIMHSEDDLRCPIEQAEQLYVALKKQRKDVLFVRFPQENHELSRAGKPRHRLERFRHLLDWFGPRLKPGE
jgi:dipeptidyl aminopeptidase/acylaminoacyl peptidase